MLSFSAYRCFLGQSWYFYCSRKACPRDLEQCLRQEVWLGFSTHLTEESTLRSIAFAEARAMGRLLPAAAPEEAAGEDTTGISVNELGFE